MSVIDTVSEFLGTEKENITRIWGDNMSFLRLASVQTGQGKLRKNVRSGYAIWKDSFVEKMETAKAYRDRWKTVEDKWFYYDLSDLERQTLALAETSDLQCCVCLESIRKGSRDHVETDPCGHHFHTKCLKTWTDTQSRNGDRHSCPMCRTEFTEQPPVQNQFIDVRVLEDELLSMILIGRITFDDIQSLSRDGPMTFGQLHSLVQDRRTV